MGNFGNCAPTVELPTRVSGIYHLDYDNFNEDVAEKVALYTKKRTEDLFLDALSGIIQNTYLATDEIICHVTALNNIQLTQFDVHKYVPQFVTKRFPDDQIFAELTSYKNTLTEQLTQLMNMWTPVNEINKQLWTMLKNDMDGSTKIEKKVVDELRMVGKEITSYTVLFEKYFNEFQMPTFLEHFNTIREVTQDFGIPTKSIRELNNSVTALRSIVPAMTNSVKFALKMNYNSLYEAQRKFRDIVMTALKVKTFVGDFSIRH